MRSAMVSIMLVAGSAAAAPFITLDNGFTLFSTGVGSDGQVIGFGEVDTNYKLAFQAEGTADDSLFASNPIPVNYGINTSSSVWLQLFANGNLDADQGTYTATYLIDLTGLNIASVGLTGSWITDNLGIDILVNGGSTGLGNTGNFLDDNWRSNPVNQFTLTAVDGLVAGLNTVQFVWENPWGPTGFRVEWEGATGVVPTPAVASLMGLGGMLVVRRLRRGA